MKNYNVVGIIKIYGRYLAHNPMIDCCRETLPVAFKTAIWFLKLMFPVSLAVTLLDFFGILPYLSGFAAPLFEWVGVPGSAAFVLVTSIFTNIYTVLALLSTLDFTMRETVIVAVMCLLSHNFVVETMVLKKTGSSALWMITLRIVGSLVIAAILNLILPDLSGKLIPVVAHKLPFGQTMQQWFIASVQLACKVVVIISVLMVVQRLLDRMGVLRRISVMLKPLMKAMGLPCNTSFLWLVGNTLGLAYGSAVMLDYTAQGKLSKRETDLLNHHLAISHSQLEDPLLFAAIGCPIGWLIIPRFILAMVTVWLTRLFYWIKDRRFENQKISA